MIGECRKGKGKVGEGEGCVLGRGVLPKRGCVLGGGVLALRSVDEFFIKNYR